MLIKSFTSARVSKKLLTNKISIEGAIVGFVILLGLFGPWLTYSYDSYATIDPDTKMGQLNYHSRIELNPLFGSIYKDNVFLERYWIITQGIFLSGILLSISAILSVFKYTSSLAHFILLMVACLGMIVFFLNIGDGISIGVFTKIGWGLRLTGIGILLMFVVSIREMSRNSLSRYMD